MRTLIAVISVVALAAVGRATPAPSAPAAGCSSPCGVAEQGQGSQQERAEPNLWSCMGDSMLEDAASPFAWLQSQRRRTLMRMPSADAIQ